MSIVHVGRLGEVLVSVEIDKSDVLNCNASGAVDFLIGGALHKVVEVMPFSQMFKRVTYYYSKSNGLRIFVDEAWVAKKDWQRVVYAIAEIVNAGLKKVGIDTKDVILKPPIECNDGLLFS